MKILLDTHIALWAVSDDSRLSLQARELITAPRNLVWVSAVSIWEISIKHSLGRGDMPISGAQALEFFAQSGYRMLSVSPEHAAAVETLALYHHDPFDRLLVAQSLTEPLRLITHDATVARYSDTVILV
jgi:PIN domain nuclease of toxin-antitoxin system